MTRKGIWTNTILFALIIVICFTDGNIGEAKRLRRFFHISKMEYGSDYIDSSDFSSEDEMEEILGKSVCAKGSPCSCSPTVLDCREQNLDTAHLFLSNWKINGSADQIVANLRHNKIFDIRRGLILNGLEGSVTKLDLSDNRIEMIEEGTFDKFRSLSKLYLSKNRLRGSDITKNLLTPALGISLNYLRLDSNAISNDLADGIFDNLLNLKTLVLDKNKDIKLSNKIFTSRLKNLKNLSLDDCNLKNLQGDLFVNLINLEHLSLSGNKFTSLPMDSLSKLPKLGWLDFSGTLLDRIDSFAFTRIPNIYRLYMTNMSKLSTVHHYAFCTSTSEVLKSLKEIDLSNSKKLTRIDDNAFCSLTRASDSIIPLKLLGISNCNLERLPSKLLTEDEWKQLEVLMLDANPYVCECTFVHSILEIYSNDSAIKKDGKNLICEKPETVAKMTFQEAEQHLCRTEGGLSIPLILFIAALIGAVMFIVGFVYARRDRFILFNRSSLPEFLISSSVENRNNIRGTAMGYNGLPPFSADMEENGNEESEERVGPVFV